MTKVKYVKTISRSCAVEINPYTEKTSYLTQQISTKILDRIHTDIRKNYHSQVPYPNWSNNYPTVLRLTSASSEEEADSFYHQLQQVITKTPFKNILIIMGALNAKVGTESWNGTLARFGLNESNKRGERLLIFCALNILCIRTFSSNRKILLGNGRGSLLTATQRTKLTVS